MALLWIGEDDEPVKPHAIPDDEVWGVEIDGEPFIEGDNTKLIYEDMFAGFPVSDLPDGFSFELVEYFDNNGLYDPGVLPFEMTRTGAELTVSIMGGAWPKGRSQEIDQDALHRLEVTKSVVDELATRVDWLREIEMGDFDEYYGGVTLTYSIVVSAELDAKDAFEVLRQRYEAITERSEALLGERSLIGVLTSGDESLFTREVVMPALERPGMLDVRLVHGVDEHGRDVLYRYQHPLGFEVLGAVQCKAGDISGRAGRQVDEILAQIQDAMAFPVYDLNTKSERPVAEVIVAVSGEFTGYAIQRIRHRLQAPTASRVWFWSARDFKEMAGRRPRA